MLVKLSDAQLHRGSIEFHKQIIFDLSLEEAEKLVADAEKMFGKEQCEKMDIYDNIRFRREHESFQNDFETRKREIENFDINDFSSFEKESEKRNQTFLEEAKKFFGDSRELTIKISW